MEKKQKSTMTPLPTHANTSSPISQTLQATPSYEDLSQEANKLEDNKPETWEEPIAKVAADVKQTNKKLENMNIILISGFVVLLIMVATIIIMVVLDYKNSYNQLTNQRFDMLEQRFQKLEDSPEPTFTPLQINEKEATPTATPG